MKINRSLLFGVAMALMACLPFTVNALAIPDGDGHAAVQLDFSKYDAQAGVVATAESAELLAYSVGSDMAHESDHRLEVRAAFGGEGDSGGEEITASDDRYNQPNERLNL